MIQGKVRDIYDEGETLLLVATDRLSAFDRAICEIPHKGEVLNQLSAWWFQQTQPIIQNHLVELPKPNSMRAKKCQVLPIEVIVRGYITGSTNTSMWTLYNQGQRNFFGTVLPEGLQKNTKLPEPVVTPTTKDKDHDRPLNREDLVNMTVWPEIEKIAVQLFQFGAELLAKKGLILVDTKYEFGLDREGRLTLIDEIHTPDSSRIWDEGTHAPYDKEIIRLWVRERCDPYKDRELPSIPPELINTVSKRYQDLYTKITGEPHQCAES